MANARFLPLLQSGRARQGRRCRRDINLDAINLKDVSRNGRRQKQAKGQNEPNKFHARNLTRGHLPRNADLGGYFRPDAGYFKASVQIHRNDLMGDTSGHNNPPATYADAGVDIEAGNTLVERIAPLAKSTAALARIATSVVLADCSTSPRASSTIRF